MTAEELQELAESDEIHETHTFLVRADAEGAFYTEEVPRGTVSMIVRAWDDPSSVGAATLDVSGAGVAVGTVHLQRGAEVYGVVRDSLGRPKAGVLLEAEWKGTPLYGEFDSGPGEEAFLVRTATKDDGSFVLAGLLPGLMVLREADGTSGSSSRERIELRAEERLEWNPVVPVHTEIRVRGLDEKGEPLVGWEARCEWSASSIRRVGAQILDDEGRARFTGLGGEKRVVTLHPPRASSRDELLVPALYVTTEPSDRELVLRLEAGESCTVAGSVRWPDGALGNDVDCDLQLTLGEFEDCGRESAEFGQRFEIGGLPAGSYRLTISAEWVGIPKELTLAEFVLEPGQTLDLGELLPQLGTVLVLDVATPSGEELTDRWIRLLPAEGRVERDGSLRLRRAAPGEPFRSGPLVPGSYIVNHRREGLAIQSKRIEVRSSADEQREVWELEEGREVLWEIHFDREPTTEEIRPQCEPGEGRVDFYIWSEEGLELWSDRMTQALDSAGESVMTLSLPMVAGDYWVGIEDERYDGWDKPWTSQKFTVLPEGGGPMVVRLNERR